MKDVWRLILLKYFFSRRSSDVPTSWGTIGQSMEYILMASFALSLHQYSRLSQKSLSQLISSHLHYVHCMDRYSIILECLDDDNYRYVFHFNNINIQLHYKNFQSFKFFLTTTSCLWFKFYIHLFPSLVPLILLSAIYCQLNHSATPQIKYIIMYKGRVTDELEKIWKDAVMAGSK